MTGAVLFDRQISVVRRAGVWRLRELDLVRRRSRTSVQGYEDEQSAREAWAAGVVLVWREWKDERA